MTEKGHRKFKFFLWRAAYEITAPDGTFARNTTGGARYQNKRYGQPEIASNGMVRIPQHTTSAKVIE